MNAHATLPNWPALMRREKAMAYLDLTPARFEKGMVEQSIPYPISVGGEERWVRAQMDEYLERLTGGVDGDWLSKTPAARGLKV